MTKVKKLDLGTQIESPVDQIQHGGSTYDPNKKVSSNDESENDSDSLLGSDGISPFLAEEPEVDTNAQILALLEKINARLDHIEAELSNLKNHRPTGPTRYVSPGPTPTWPLGPDDPREYYIGDVPNSPFEVGDTPESTSPRWAMPPVITSVHCDGELCLCCGSMYNKSNASQTGEIAFGSKEEAEQFLNNCSSSIDIGSPRYNAAVKLIFGGGNQ